MKMMSLWYDALVTGSVYVNNTWLAAALCSSVLQSTSLINSRKIILFLLIVFFFSVFMWIRENLFYREVHGYLWKMSIYFQPFHIRPAATPLDKKAETFTDDQRFECLSAESGRVKLWYRMIESHIRSMSVLEIQYFNSSSEMSSSFHKCKECSVPLLPLTTSGA